jgi:hypothetical protein
MYQYTCRYMTGEAYDDDDDVYLDKNNKRGVLKNLSSTCET